MDLSREHALDEHDALGFLAVGRALDVAAGGTGGGHDALVLERGDDVGVLTRTVLAVDRPVHEVVAGGSDDGAHGFRDFLVLHLIVDGPGRADLGADAAFPGGQLAAELGIDGRLLGNACGKGILMAWWGRQIR